MKRILILIFLFSSVAYAQPGAKIIIKGGSSPGSGTGISQVGANIYGLIKVNDSTYKVDSFYISTRYRLYKVTDSILTFVALKVNISDTAAMLLNYRHWLQGYLKAADIAGKLNISDTAAMLSGYPRKTTTLTINGVSLDLSANRTWNVGTLVAADTVNKYVTWIYRKTASDSVFYVKGGVPTFAFRDSIGAAGGGITSINSQTGVTQTISQGVGILVASAANDHNIKADTLTLSTRLWRQKGIDSVVSLINNKVSSISVASANGLAGTSSGGTTPVLTLSTTVNGMVKGNATAFSAATSGTDFSAGTSALATGILKSTTSTGALTIAVAGDFPTLNQNTTGGAGFFTTGRNIAMTGDVAWNVNFNGSADATAAGTLATVNSNIGTFNNITINAKGLATAGSNVAYLVGADTTNKYVTWFYRKTASDSVFYVKGGIHTFAFKDSIGGVGAVTSVSGTANRITSTGGATPVIDIAATYVGQTSITTLGTIATGVWQGTIIGKAYGGTGEDNSTGGTANTFWARPNGATGAASYRAIVAADISNAAADGATKGVAAFNATYFDATAGVVNIDLTNGLVSGSQGGYLSSAKYSFFDSKADTTANYTALRAYTGTANVMFVKDARTGGTFFKVPTGSENGATMIVDANGGKWQRDMDSSYWRPEWFEIGGKDRNGANYDATTGTGIGSEAVAIKNIVLLAGPSGVIRYTNNKIYEIDQFVPIKQKQEHKGARFKRAAPVQTLLTNAEANGSTLVEVNSVTGLRAGMWFLVKAVGAAGGDFGNTSANQTGDEGHIITSISGTTLTISASTPIRKAMAAGDTVVTVTPMFYRENSILNVSDSDYHFIVKNCEFDGNKAQNRYFNDYQQPATICLFGGYLEAYGSTFKNAPGENIYLTGGKIQDCFMFYNQGSGLHWTNNLATLDSMYLGTYIDRLVADSNCLGDAVKQGHSEAFATGSTKSNNSFWTNCKISNNGTSASRAKSVFGNYTQDDGIIHIIGGLYTNNRQLMYLSGMDSTTMKGDRIVIRDAKFRNSGAITIAGLDIRKANGVNGVLISNNEFTNTRVYMDNVANVRVTNNYFLTDSSTYVRWDDSRADGAATTSNWGGTAQQTMFMITAYSDRLTITNNHFIGFDNDSLQTGVQLQLSDSIYRKQSSLMTDYYYCQAVNFSDNYISGFRYATSFGINSFAKSAVNWSLNNNTIDLARYDRFAADYVYGLQVAPGMVANGGTVTGYHPSNFSWPVMVFGVKSTGNFAKIEGGKAMNITVKGKSNYGINVDPNNATPYNTTVMNNTLYAGTINFSANATTNLLEYSGNKIISNSAMNNYQVPIIQRVGENKTQY